MKAIIERLRRSFTIVELVIVIAVIAILAAVLIPTFSGIVNRAGESQVIQQARNAWNEVAFTYASGYKGFAADSQEINGWYYDYVDGVAKYNIDEKYTVTYDGETFVATDFDPEKERVWNKIETASENFSGYDIGDEPYSLVLTYYDGIYSRGFSWITRSSVTDSFLFVVEGNGGSEADFLNANIIVGTSDSSRAAYTSHKAWVTGLKASTVYSYKVGSATGWKYGVFKTDSAESPTITAIHLSDAQTIDPTKLEVWENTMAQAVETAGHGLDLILYNGDQFDSNMTGIGSGIDRGVRHAIAKETVEKYIGDVPYMASSGNHEPASSERYIHVNNCTVDYGTKGDEGYTGTSSSGGYYSFDYNFAHFVVLNTNEFSYGSQTSVASFKGRSFTVDKNFKEQAEWLLKDLDDAHSDTRIKWIIVVMHIGAYATGDHSNGQQAQNIITTLSPIFSAYHVDLVLQAHDHTYNKTLPYKWDSTGYTTAYNNSEVVNFNVEKTTVNEKNYDLNPNGTYYVTTGAAGHRYGAREAKDGVWAEIDKTNYDPSATNDSLVGLAANATFTDNTYKIEVGRITESNSYESYSGNGSGDTNYPFVSPQVYNEGDPSTGNVNAPMFGILNMTADTLTYDFYTVEGNTVKLFDSLNIMKR